MYDAVHLFARAMGQLSVAGDIDTESLSCNKRDTWDHGLSILNYMKIVSSPFSTCLTYIEKPVSVKNVSF